VPRTFIPPKIKKKYILPFIILPKKIGLPKINVRSTIIMRLHPSPTAYRSFSKNFSCLIYKIIVFYQPIADSIIY